MKHSDLFIESDSAIVLEELVDEDGDPVTTATVEMTELKDASGDDVAGITLPVTMTHDAGGTYRGQLPSDLELEEGGIYKAKVRAVVGGITKTWRETLIAKYDEA